MLTNGMLMVITGISGLVITIIAAIVFFIVMRKKERKALSEVNELNKPIRNSGLSVSTGQKTYLIASESINNNGNVTDIINETGTGIDVLVSDQASCDTDILESQETEVLMTKTTVIND